MRIENESGRKERGECLGIGLLVYLLGRQGHFPMLCVMSRGGTVAYRHGFSNGNLMIRSRV